MTFQTLKDRLALGARAFRRDQRGSVIVMIPVFFLVAAGFAALAVDMGHLYTMQSRVQNTADAAALAGAGQIPDEANARNAAINLAQKNLPDEENGTVLPGGDVTLGSWAGATRTFTPAGTPTNAVRVVTRRANANGNAVELFFARLMGFDEADVEASAVALRRDVSGCIVALDPTADGALTISGTADVNLDCGALVNSDSPTAIIENGGACLTATSIATAGGYSGDCLNPVPDMGMPTISDPLADLDPPPPAPCDHAARVDALVDTTLWPGVYCGGISIASDPQVHFEPGTYTLKGDGLHIAGSSVVTGDDVTFYFDPATTGVDAGGETRSLYIAGSSSVELRAPGSGYYEGILFYQDPSAPSNLVNRLTGGADMELEGMFYFPNTEVKFSGNSDVTGSDWISIVARTVEFVGTSSLSQDLSEVAYSPGAAFVSLHLVD